MKSRRISQKMSTIGDLTSTGCTPASPRWRDRRAKEQKDATKKGTKRKRAPYTKGPCEHGVKYRSNCKVCSACPHGSGASVQGVRWGLNLRARSPALSVQGGGGGSICSTAVSYSCKVRRVWNLQHGRRPVTARSAAGARSASTVVSAMCKSAVGLKSASTVVSAIAARVQEINT